MTGATSQNRQTESDTVTTSDNAVSDAINGVLKFGGTLVDESEYQRRVEICKGCDKFGTVNALGFKMDGCIICGCPTATKPRYETYFSWAKLQIIKAVCPHENGNKWAVVVETK